mgnify:CR=1 FL=1
MHVTKSWSVSRLFLRTQDDAMYITSGEGAHSHYDRIITWNDANGWSFKFSAGGSDAEFSTLNEQRCFVPSQLMGVRRRRHLLLPQQRAERGYVGAVIENIRIEDPIADVSGLYSPRSHTNNGVKKGEVPTATLRNITFANIVATNFSTTRHSQHGKPLPHGLPNQLRGSRVAQVAVSNVRFVNITIGGFGLPEVIREDSMFNLSTDVPGSLVNVTVDGKLVAG